MKFSINRVSVYSLIVLISFTSFSFAQSELQNDLGTEVQVRDGFGGSTRWVRCYPTDKLIVTKREFEKLLKDEKCSRLKLFIKVDFEKHTLINYSIGGDCFMSVTHKIFRNNKTKTYTIEVKNYWGKCRAGGSHYGWVVIDKVPADYTVKLKEIQIDGNREIDKTSLSSLLTKNHSKPPSIKDFETKQVDLNGCIPMYHKEKYVIKDKESYLKHIRKDAQTEKCIKNSKNLDFEKYSYIGIKIRSGYCRYPKGLEYGLTKDNFKKRYTLDVSYTDPEGQVCRALSRYELWLQVPKLQDDFEVVFQINPKPRSNENSKN